MVILYIRAVNILNLGLFKARHRKREVVVVEQDNIVLLVETAS